MKKNLFFVIMCIACCILPCRARAYGEVTINAEADKTSLAVGETLSYKVSIDSTERLTAQAPAFPDFAGFRVIGKAQSNSFAFVRGKQQVRWSYVFVLAPVSPGTLTIKPVSVQINGQVYQSADITVTVEPHGANASQTGTDEGKSVPGQPLPRQELAVGDKITL